MSEIRRPTRHSLGSLGIALFCSLAALVILVAPAANAEAPPQQLWQKCELGTGAGQCISPSGLVSDPNSGHVFVAEQNDARITELTVWGEFVKAWGWGVRNGAAELQTCTSESGCQGGLESSGPGGLKRPQGVALDQEGNIYVVDWANHRVQKFDPTGGPDGDEAEFLLMFGGDVNKTKAEAAAPESERNVCPVDPGDVCQAGTTGSGSGQFASSWSRSSYLAAGPGDTLYVGDEDRVQVFGTDGNYLKSIPLPGEAVFALAVDPAGYALVSYQSQLPCCSTNPVKEQIVKIGPSGAVVCKAKVESPMALATDAAGNFYATDGGLSPSLVEVTVRKFDSECNEDKEFAFETGLGVFGKDTEGAQGIATGSGCGIDGAALYIDNTSFIDPLVRAYYPSPDPGICPPPEAPPMIADQYAASVNAQSAVVRAKISSHFWPDATYYVQYGTEDCAARPDACAKTALAPGSSLNSKVDDPVTTTGVFLSGLEPNTTYHYRFIAQSGGGGPVFGIGEAEEDATFTTYPFPSAAKADCPNQGLRTGPSASLPDCRAYEMVSPVDKDGGDILVLAISLGGPASLNQSAGSGERLTYSSYRAFGGAQGAPYTSQYLATRGPAGWSNEAISPPQEGSSTLEVADLDTRFKGFDEELCNGWLMQGTEPVLAPGGVPGYANIYRRSNCGASGYEAVTKVAPMFEPDKGEVAISPRAYVPSIQAFSADGSHVVFRVAGKLVDDAASCGEGEANNCPRQVYDYHDGALQLVCVFPDGTPSTESCSVGSLGNPDLGRNSNVQHAVSADGSRIFWTSSKGSSGELGKLYLRIDGAETRTLSTAPTRFRAAATDGSRAIFSVDPGVGAPEELYEYDIDGEGKARIAKGVVGFMGASDDAKRVYFASKEVLTGDEENSEGDKAQVGQPNLYLYEAGENGGFTFVASLSATDEGHLVSPLHQQPFYRTSRVTPDGLHAAFTSVAPLTGRDNTDAESGEPSTEVFLYDASTGKLRCGSCNPSNARPQGREYEVNGDPAGLWIAGTIPGWPSQMGPSRVLSDDGRRLFFESPEPLLPTDTNGQKDVYEWEAGESQADCDALGAQLFLAAEGGCLSLISSGESPADSEFVDAGRSGRDVFITTASSMLPQDPGLIDLYDAREGGGFAPPPGRSPACEGEACQGPVSPPNDPTPASSTFQGAGNVVEKPARKKKRKKKRHHGKHHRQSKQKSQGKQKRAARNQGGQR